MYDYYDLVCRLQAEVKRWRRETRMLWDDYIAGADVTDAQNRLLWEIIRAVEKLSGGVTDETV